MCCERYASAGQRSVGVPSEAQAMHWCKRIQRPSSHSMCCSAAGGWDRAEPRWQNASLAFTELLIFLLSLHGYERTDERRVWSLSHLCSTDPDLVSENLRSVLHAKCDVGWVNPSYSTFCPAEHV